jgi:ABC-2 type transport system ATP-binding protein
MTAVIDTHDLTKRYGRRVALQNCTLHVPAEKVVGLVGPNGAGKSTLLQLAVGLLAPTAGTIEVLGGAPTSGAAQLAKIGFVAQDAPVYPSLSVADHLRLGAHLNPRWDDRLAEARIGAVGLDPNQKAGRLSGGQRAQLALTLAIAKRPDLLVLDEPVASLDPLARREFLQGLMEFAAESGVSVVMSSHLIADLERVCDYLVVLSASRVLVVGEVDDLLAAHHRITGPPTAVTSLPTTVRVIQENHTPRQSSLIVHSLAEIDGSVWSVDPVGLEDVVLAYLASGAGLGVPARAEAR